jgi:hypothetical protein
VTTDAVRSDITPPVAEFAPIAEATRADSGGEGFGVVARSLPWVVTAGFVVLALLASETPIEDVGRYGAYLIFGVAVPGVLMWRALVGSRGNLPEDVAVGAVTGLGLELGAWALATGLGVQQWLWVWPAAVVVTFLLVPRLRRHWRIADRRPLPLMWSWGVAVAVVLVASFIWYAYFTPWLLPPHGATYYNDLLWHLGIVHELARALPPEIPQVAGEPFRYHWFSHAHMAAAHLISGAPEATVLLRLWILPVVAMMAMAAAVLAREVSRVWWSGPVAAWAVVALHGVNLLPVQAISVYTVVPLSPSHLYIAPIVLVAAVLIVKLLRGERLRGAWVVLIILVAAASGAKPTGLPMMLAATLLAGLALVCLRQRAWRMAALLALIMAAALPASHAFVAGSDNPGWSRFSLFDFVEWFPLYGDLTGGPGAAVAGPLLPEGVVDLSARSVAVLVLMLLVMVGGHLGRLLPLLALGSRRFRRDPAAWWLAGMVAAAWGAFLLFSHVALAQAYFLSLGVPFAGVLAAWVLASAVPRTIPRSTAVVSMVVGVAMGAFVVWLARQVTPAVPDADATSLTARAVSFAVPIGVVAAALLLGLLSWAAARRIAPSLRGMGVAVLMAAVAVGGPLEGSAVVGKLAAERAIAGEIPIPAGPRVGAGAPAALAWIEANTAADDVVATNLHCAGVETVPNCTALSFWVSGLGGRRTVIEGWGYTGEVVARNSPPPWPERFDLNEQAFTAPTPEVLDRLRDEYGARWLFADSEAGPVSPNLGRLATERFTSGEVTIYELR